jgi:uncharacterized protein (TIRG00374 family)
LQDFFTKKWDSERIAKLTVQIDEAIDRLYLTFEMFAGRAKMGLVLGFLLTIVFWACEYAIASVIMIGLGYPPNFLLSLVFQLIIAVILMVPSTPGGAGVAEISYAVFLFTDSSVGGCRSVCGAAAADSVLLEPSYRVHCKFPDCEA